MNLNKNAEMLATYDIKKLLIKLSLPAIAGMAVNALYNFVDAIFVGRGVSTVAIGGLGLAFPIQMIVMAVGLMVGMGSASIFSRAFGEKNYEKMQEAVNTALRLDIILAVVFTVLGFLFLDELLLIFGATDDNIGYARDYLSIILIGLVPLSLTMVLNNLTRAEGRANIAMISMLIGTGLNIILDPIFIFDFGFGLGIKGAAIATIISQIIAFLYIFFQSKSVHSALKIHFNDFKMSIPIIKETIAIGFPSFLRNSVGAFITIIIMNLIRKYAINDIELYQSIYSTINRILTFIFMPSFGIVQGLAPIVGFSYGAKNYKRLHEVIIYTMKIILIYFFFGVLLVQFAAEPMFLLFDSESGSSFITLGSDAFRIISIGFLMVGFQIVISSVYQSEGHPMKAAIVALSRQVLFFIPLVFLFTELFSVEGIWWAFVASDLLAGFISMLLYFHELRRIKEFEKIST